MIGAPSAAEFWGKLERDNEGRVTAWHPLLAHCADVAACCQALLVHTLLGNRLAALAGLPRLTEIQIARLCVIAVLHDLGKANHGFQNKWMPAKPQHGHVSEVVALFGRCPSVEAALSEALTSTRMRAFFAEPENAEDFLRAAISHHGRPARAEKAASTVLWRKERARDPMAEVARLRAASEVWFPDAWAPGASADLLPATPEFQHGFAGLVMLADWLGSSQLWFPYSETTEDRMPFAGEAAARALMDIGLLATPAREALQRAPLTFSQVLRKGQTARPAQRAMAESPCELAPSLTVLESETGSGKTEAALYRFLQLHRAGLVDGLYFALPTRTAADQIHRRVVRVVDQAFPDPSTRPPVVLAVPGYLRVDEALGVRLPGFKVLWNDDPKERYRYRGWAAEHPKRYLAGAIVVGTIDQVLLSTLRVSHSHLRASSLLRQLLVVDEVHASDAYMNTLLRKVLSRHAQAGGHALLMSATLGAAARLRLLGDDRPHPSFEDCCQEPYPLVTHRVGAETRSVAVAEPGTAKAVEIVSEPWMDEPARIARTALDAAEQGAAVLVIRNTVNGCIAVQQTLEALAEERNQVHLLMRCNGVPAPHHARFTREDRLALDAAIEQHFGTGAPRRGVVAVATQTVQQSLDLDADFLLTDLCPMDVLLQRIGRLHRNLHRPSDERPPAFRAAKVVVLTPASDLVDLLRSDGQARSVHGLGIVYDDVRVLVATLKALRARPTVSIPIDNRWLVESATHPDVLDEVASLEPRLRLHGQLMLGKTSAEQLHAKRHLTDWTAPFSDEEAACFSDLSGAEQISTRLGEGDRRCKFDPPLHTPFGKTASELNIPAWIARGVGDAEQATMVQSESGTTRFRFGTKEYVYDRLGLRPAG
jgi:CRISPR-associated endonuclease/helicase Cas3